MLATVVGMPRDARAIPVFARKYETSCQTCHTAYPKLNPFGEAFRRNGHRFPAGEEVDSTKKEPVALGQEAHKRVFPNAIWPNDLPGASPLAVALGSSMTYTPGPPNQVSFAGVGANITFTAAATLGDSFSGWAGATVMAMPRPTGGETTSISIERVFMNVTPFEQPWATLRVGRIETGALPVTMHRTLGYAPWLGATTVFDNPFSLDPTQLGIEANGVVAAGRLGYTAGVVAGPNNLVNPSKDVYGRVSYKLGGMRMDGIGGATESDPWRETSATFGVFGLSGIAMIGDPAVATQEDAFSLMGGDVNLLFRDLNLIVAYERGANHRPALAEPNEPKDHWNFFAQLDYVLFPWLIPTARAERRFITEHAVEDRLSGGVYFVLRANVRAQILAAAQRTEGAGQHLTLTQAQGGLNVAF